MNKVRVGLILYASPHAVESGGNTIEAVIQGNTGPVRSVDDPASLRGATQEEVEALMPRHFGRTLARTQIRGGEKGMRFNDPDRPGDQIRIMAGDPKARDPLHRGPRVIISTFGTKRVIPLQGNPSL